jgi:hypothetical protein
MRSASRPQSDAAGRSTSVGQVAKLSMIGRRLAISSPPRAQAAICASTSATSLGSTACSA